MCNLIQVGESKPHSDSPGVLVASARKAYVTECLNSSSSVFVAPCAICGPNAIVITASTSVECLASAIIACPSSIVRVPERIVATGFVARQRRVFIYVSAHRRSPAAVVAPRQAASPPPPSREFRHAAVQLIQTIHFAVPAFGRGPCR